MDTQASEKLNNFFSGFKKLFFKKGETILRPDDQARNVFYLKKGYARLYSISKNAQELTFIIYKPGDFFPLIPAINNIPVSYYMEAMTLLELYQAPVEDFRRFIKNNSKVLYELTIHILTRLGGVFTRMEYAIFGNAQNKVAAIILICAERFGKDEKKGILVQVPLTHQDIANLLGVARETVSIEMKKLQKMNLINYRGKHLIVKDIQKLKDNAVLA